MTRQPAPTQGPVGVDFAPLESRPDWPDVKAFRRLARKAHTPGSRQAPGTLPLVALAVLPLFLLAWLAFTQVGAHLGSGRTALVPPVILAAGLAVIAFLWLAALAGRSGWMRWYRIDRFATANGFQWHITSPDPGYPGTVFQQGTDRVCGETIETTTGRPLRLGEYRYTLGKGKNRKIRRWGFIALRLDHRMPHMMLDGRGNNGLLGVSNLPASFARDQVLHLEGDFDRYFTLYCPRDYEKDALYLFTPDIMALFIDHAAAFDAEIVDDWLFLYAAAPFDIGHPATMRRMLGVASAVGERLAQAAGRYRDDRATARAGRQAAGAGRLRPRVPWLGILVTAAAVAAILIFLL
ncbi:MAG TPA: hypothetical protein VFQ96_02320 [Microbacteriaceae bacterium]|nr:hypothetical protein [Microbacteriaceae bacterium]